jgi:glutamine synthetase
MPGAPDYGVVYTPASVGLAVGQQKASLSDNVLDSLGIRWIRLTWCDWTNTIRYHVLSRDYFQQLLHSERPGFTLLKAAFGIVLLHVCDGFTLTGEYLLVLDESTFRVCPYAPGHATILGYFQHIEPHPQYGLEMLQDPRTQLARVERLAREKAGVTYLVGFENEFVLLKSTSPSLVPVNNQDYAVSQKLAPGSVEANVLEEIVDSLVASGIRVEKYHAEAAPGQVCTKLWVPYRILSYKQFEVINGPLPPLQAADALLITRETIFSIAAKHGLRATFAPRVYVYNGM